ncbi:MAG: hypothetical protein ACKV2V_14795 [Blastocatellia bacterium]
MQRLTYVTLLVGILMMTAFAGLWWGMLHADQGKPARTQPGVITAPAKPASGNSETALLP